MKSHLYCHVCDLELDEKKDIIIPYHDKLYHKQCIMEEYEEQGWYTCSYCCYPDKADFYLDKLICKEECITVEKITCEINKMDNIIYNDKIYHDYCFQKYIDSLQVFTDDNSSDDLDDDTWIDKKKEFWKKNDISPIKIKDGSISPKELEKMLKDKYT